MTYNRIGKTYARTRRPDPRFAQALIDALGVEPGALIADIGAGTGNYANELADQGFRVVAIEPSSVMWEQREAHMSVSWIGAVAEHIPLCDGAVEAAMCMLSSHHFADVLTAVDELHRVARGTLVFLTFDPRRSEPFWFDDYFPSIWRESFNVFGPVEHMANTLVARTDRTVTLKPLLLPWDVRDLVAAAGWRRPEIYLDPAVRAGMSPFALADQSEVERGVARLEHDVQSGVWQRTYGALQNLDTFDVGYRIVVASPLVC